jgi:hypothetical protein
VDRQLRKRLRPTGKLVDDALIVSVVSHPALPGLERP